MFGWVRTGARAKATATSIARSVQARREEVHGSAASKTDDRVKWNATRNITRMLNRAGMAIEVPREILKYEIQDGSVIELPVVKPSSWLQLILKKYPELLFPQNNMEEELQVFWNHYRFIQPNHEIFKSPPEQLKRTLPILVHGDEGRYLKKGNYLIATIEMMLGSTPTKLKECCCEADPVLERYPEVHNDEGNIFSRRECEVASKQLVNLSGNCFLSKYLLFGMASQQYKAHPDLVHQAMGMVSYGVGGFGFVAFPRVSSGIRTIFLRNFGGERRPQISLSDGALDPHISEHWNYKRKSCLLAMSSRVTRISVRRLGPIAKMARHYV